MENKALYHEVAIERENGLGCSLINFSLDCLPATRHNFIAQTPTCPTHQLALGSPIYALPCKKKRTNLYVLRSTGNAYDVISHRRLSGPRAPQYFGQVYAYAQ